MITLFSILTSAKLWRYIKDKYSDLTMDEVAESVKEAYIRDYNENMAKVSSQYVKPNPATQQLMESDTLETTVQIADFNIRGIEDVKERLIEIGAFNNKNEINHLVDKMVSECVSVFDRSSSFNNNIKNEEIEDYKIK